MADNGGGVKSAAERAENDKPVVPPTTPPPKEEGARQEPFRGHNFPLRPTGQPIVGRPMAPNSERK